jgi:hypothetical protein
MQNSRVEKEKSLAEIILHILFTSNYNKTIQQGTAFA